MSQSTRERVYIFYTWHIRTRGYAPTQPEAALAVGVTTRTLRRHLQSLIDEGRLAYHPHYVWRGVVLVEDGEAA
jgi:predicted ArsR family transcriptional regulator